MTWRGGQHEEAASHSQGPEQNDQSAAEAAWRRRERNRAHPAARQGGLVCCAWHSLQAQEGLLQVSSGSIHNLPLLTITTSKLPSILPSAPLEKCDGRRSKTVGKSATPTFSQPQPQQRHLCYGSHCQPLLLLLCATTITMLNLML